MPSAIRVMCVEDNELVADVLARKLSGDPAFVWLGWVSDAQALCEKAASENPHVVCMDLHMPGQDAVDMIRRLSRCAPGARVMILSGHDAPESVRAVADAGAWGYLSKAEDSRAIIEAIRRVAAGEKMFGAYAAMMARVDTASSIDIKPPGFLQRVFGRRSNGKNAS
ncbi:MAG: response regulator transcription factor [Planctomycetes bacterium]|nr:response regulator transcription factor [Planctomycetota bacterium]